MGHIAAMDMACTALAFIDGLGGPEMMLIFVVVLLLFGGQKLPEFARGLGKTMREFKKAAAGVEDEFKRALEEDERKKAAVPAAAQLTASSSAASATAVADEPSDAAEDIYSEAGPSAPESEYHPTDDDVPSEEHPPETTASAEHPGAVKPIEQPGEATEPPDSKTKPPPPASPPADQPKP